MAGKTYGLSVRYRPASTDLIVMIHGLGCSQDTFVHIWDRPEFNQYALLSFDLVGFGRSDKPEDFSYTMEDQARICRLLIGRFHESALHIAAHSMGGAIGLLLAEHLPDRLKSFTNIEGNLIGSDCGLISRRTVSLPFDPVSYTHLRAHET